MATDIAPKKSDPQGAQHTFCSHLSVALDDCLRRAPLPGHPASPVPSVPLAPHLFRASSAGVPREYILSLLRIISWDLWNPVDSDPSGEWGQRRLMQVGQSVFTHTLTNICGLQQAGTAHSSHFSWYTTQYNIKV